LCNTYLVHDLLFGSGICKKTLDKFALTFRVLEFCTRFI
jgi:hypothetical protein